MLILSRVCAEFTDSHGKTVFAITPQNLLSFLEAPETIQEDPLFHLMLADGSLEAVRSVEQQKGLEKDPVADASPEGKKPKASRAKTPAADSAASSADADAAAPVADAPVADAAPVDSDASKTAKKATK